MDAKGKQLSCVSVVKPDMTKIIIIKEKLPERSMKMLVLPIVAFWFEYFSISELYSLLRMIIINESTFVSIFELHIHFKILTNKKQNLEKIYKGIQRE